MVVRHHGRRELDLGQQLLGLLDLGRALLAHRDPARVRRLGVGVLGRELRDELLLHLALLRRDELRARATAALGRVLRVARAQARARARRAPRRRARAAGRPRARARVVGVVRERHERARGRLEEPARDAHHHRDARERQQLLLVAHRAARPEPAREASKRSSAWPMSMWRMRSSSANSSTCWRSLRVTPGCTSSSGSSSSPSSAPPAPAAAPPPGARAAGDGLGALAVGGLLVGLLLRRALTSAAAALAAAADAVMPWLPISRISAAASSSSRRRPTP